MLILKKPYVDATGKLHNPPSWRLCDCLMVENKAEKRAKMTMSIMAQDVSLKLADNLFSS